jgi:1-acyl-sn-glycerol-3-phosphate acyltransferase
MFFSRRVTQYDGEIGEFKKGFGVLAKVTGAMLVPVAIIGAHEAWPSTAKYPKRYPIKVRFGKPLCLKIWKKKDWPWAHKILTKLFVWQQEKRSLN